jgi:hypothetical protein
MVNTQVSNNTAGDSHSTWAAPLVLAMYLKSFWLVAKRLSMLSLFLTLVSFLQFILHAHTLNQMDYNTRGLLTSRAPSALLTNEEYAKFTRRTYPAISISERYSFSNLELLASSEAWDLGLENSDGNRLRRQVRTLHIAANARDYARHRLVLILIMFIVRVRKSSLDTGLPRAEALLSPFKHCL